MYRRMSRLRNTNVIIKSVMVYMSGDIFNLDHDDSYLGDDVGGTEHDTADSPDGKNAASQTERRISCGKTKNMSPVSSYFSAICFSTSFLYVTLSSCPSYFTKSRATLKYPSSSIPRYSAASECCFSFLSTNSTTNSATNLLGSPFEAATYVGCSNFASLATALSGNCRDSFSTFPPHSPKGGSSTQFKLTYRSRNLTRHATPGKLSSTISHGLTVATASEIECCDENNPQDTAGESLGGKPRTDGAPSGHSDHVVTGGCDGLVLASDIDSLGDRGGRICQEKRSGHESRVAADEYTYAVSQLANEYSGTSTAETLMLIPRLGNSIHKRSLHKKHDGRHGNGKEDGNAHGGFVSEADFGGELQAAAESASVFESVANSDSQVDPYPFLGIDGADLHRGLDRLDNETPPTTISQDGTLATDPLQVEDLLRVVLKAFTLQTNALRVEKDDNTEVPIHTYSGYVETGNETACEKEEPRRRVASQRNILSGTRRTEGKKARREGWRSNFDIDVKEESKDSELKLGGSEGEGCRSFGSENSTSTAHKRAKKTEPKNAESFLGGDTKSRGDASTFILSRDSGNVLSTAQSLKFPASFHRASDIHHVDVDKQDILNHENSNYNEDDCEVINGRVVCGHGNVSLWKNQDTARNAPVSESADKLAERVHATFELHAPFSIVQPIPYGAFNHYDRDSFVYLSRHSTQPTPAPIQAEGKNEAPARHISQAVFQKKRLQVANVQSSLFGDDQYVNQEDQPLFVGSTRDASQIVGDRGGVGDESNALKGHATSSFVMGRHDRHRVVHDKASGKHEDDAFGGEASGGNAPDTCHHIQSAASFIAVDQEEYKKKVENICEIAAKSATLKLDNIVNHESLISVRRKVEQVADSILPSVEVGDTLFKYFDESITLIAYLKFLFPFLIPTVVGIAVFLVWFLVLCPKLCCRCCRASFCCCSEKSRDVSLLRAIVWFIFYALVVCGLTLTLSFGLSHCSEWLTSVLQNGCDAFRTVEVSLFGSTGQEYTGLDQDVSFGGVFRMKSMLEEAMGLLNDIGQNPLQKQLVLARNQLEMCTESYDKLVNKFLDDLRIAASDNTNARVLSSAAHRISYEPFLYYLRAESDKRIDSKIKPALDQVISQMELIMKGQVISDAKQAFEGLATKVAQLSSALEKPFNAFISIYPHFLQEGQRAILGLKIFNILTLLLSTLGVLWGLYVATTEKRQSGSPFFPALYWNSHVFVAGTILCLSGIAYAALSPLHDSCNRMYFEGIKTRDWWEKRRFRSNPRFFDLLKVCVNPNADGDLTKLMGDTSAFHNMGEMTDFLQKMHDFERQMTDINYRTCT